VVSIRFNVVSQRSTYPLEEIYNKAALMLNNNKTASLEEVRQLLSRVYLSDDEFRNDFSALRMKNGGVWKKRLRYILCELEKHIAPKDLADETTTATIEHILPENPDDTWSDWKTDHERYVNRLGNYTLLERDLNSAQAANRNYSEKLKIYRQSQYAITRRIDADEWNKATIEERQKQMARWATSIWRF
jgi:hypothetical protein